MKIVSSRLVALMLLASALLVTGCATKFEKQAFNSEASANIKKITVAKWNDQEEYPAVVLNHPGNSFGLIGAAIAAADTSKKTKLLNDALDPAKTKVTSAFYDKALPSLKQMGYDVVIVSAKRGDKIDDVKAALNKPQGQDATLLLEMSAGYNAAGASTDYLPAMFLMATMTDSKSSKVLYSEMYQYGYNSGNKDVVNVDAAADCKFKDIEVLTANIDKTRNCLMAGPELLAKQIASDLKK